MYLQSISHRPVASGIVLALCVLAVPRASRADEPITLLEAFVGNRDFFATGAPLAVDGPDNDTTQVDMLAQPANVDVTALDVPPTAQVRAAFLYWGGSIANSDCVAPGLIDDTVDFTPPGKALEPIVADECYCSEAGAQSYDVQLCRTDVTSVVGDLIGTYTVDGFDALISNGTTHNASFSIVLVYSDNALPPRRIALYDGLQTMASNVNAMETVTLAGLDVDDPAAGDLTWYVLEGDVGGGGAESVSVTASPGGGTLDLTDALNPSDNPMNHTINTTAPVQADSIGVDIDQFSIDTALSPNDVALDVIYSAGNDKWWIAYNIVGVNVYEPVLSTLSTKDWVLFDDTDGDTLPSPGDTIRYTIHLENTGNADGVAAIDDAISDNAESWALVDAAGGADMSAPGTLIVADIPLAMGMAADVVFDLVIADVADGTLIENVANYTAEPGGLTAGVLAPVIVVSNPGVGTDTGANTGDAGETSGASTGDDSGADSTATGGPAGSGEAGSGSAAGSSESGSADAGRTATGGASNPSETSTRGGSGVNDDGGCACASNRERHSGEILWLGFLVGLRRRRPCVAIEG